MTTPIPERGADNLERILETAHEAFISIDDEGRVLAWNREAERTFGWRRERALGRLLRDLIIPAPYRDRHQEGLRRFLETGEGPLIDKRIEMTALHRSGRELPVELTISALAENGTWTFHAFIHDISDRYRANELQARLATLVEHSADAIVSRSADGTITSWNPAAERLYGWRADEVIGRGIEVIVPEGVQVELNDFAIMGGNTGPRNTNVPRGAPVVRVRGFSLMGGIGVTRKKPGETGRPRRHWH